MSSIASSTGPRVDALLGQEKWHEERHKLRSIILSCGLAETVKWGKLCYTFGGSTVAIIYGLKAYCAVGFFKGSLLADDKKILVSPGDNSQAMRQIRFTTLEQIVKQQRDLKAYLRRAIEAEKKGLKVDFKEKDELVFPQELTDQFDADPGLAAAFHKLTPGRQRGYVLHIGRAKQSKTRVARIEKCAARIREGKGLSDR